jgi:hypothetical protein
MWLTCRYKYRPCPLGQQEFFVSSAKLKTHLRLRRLLCQGHRHQFPYSSRCYVRQGVNIVGDFYQPAQNSRNVRVTTAAHLRNILSGTSWNPLRRSDLVAAWRFRKDELNIWRVQFLRNVLHWSTSLPGPKVENFCKSTRPESCQKSDSNSQKFSHRWLAPYAQGAAHS